MYDFFFLVKIAFRDPEICRNCDSFQRPPPNGLSYSLLQNARASDHVWLLRHVRAGGTAGCREYPGRQAYRTVLPTGNAVWFLCSSVSSAKLSLGGAPQPPVGGESAGKLGHVHQLRQVVLEFASSMHR